MARMHSRKHGRHGSTRPPKHKPAWLAYDKAEVEKIVEKLAKEGKTSTEIGIILRDQYGVPLAKFIDVKISKIIQEVAPREVPEDIYNLIKQAVRLHKHLQEHHGDAKAIHGVELVESKVRRLGKYYARTGRLPKGWKYSIEDAKLLVK